ncbi:MAG TPA: hypothetical protein VNV25_25435 [Gemmatimonadaceae bacterium]|jgi:hypothetical protein|nr:hypothetical protein [Gemmatimonadaceae bacterium]
MKAERHKFKRCVLPPGQDTCCICNRGMREAVMARVVGEPPIYEYGYCLRCVRALHKAACAPSKKSKR